MSRSKVVAAAVDLSERKGIEGWSMKDIAGALGVVPSVIYYYFPNKDSLCDAVVDQVFRDLSIPDPDLEWKEWFRQCLRTMCAVLSNYYGITDRLAYGKLTAAATPMLDVACQKLLDAGFGDKTGLAYSVITNTALHSISARALRSTHRTGTRHDLKEMLDRLAPMAENSPGLGLIISQYIGPLAQPENEDRLSAEYYELTIASVLDGVERIILGGGSGEIKPAGRGTEAAGRG